MTLFLRNNAFSWMNNYNKVIKGMVKINKVIKLNKDKLPSLSVSGLNKLVVSIIWLILLFVEVFLAEFKSKESFCVVLILIFVLNVRFCDLDFSKSKFSDDSFDFKSSFFDNLDCFTNSRLLIKLSKKSYCCCLTNSWYLS